MKSDDEIIKMVAKKFGTSEDAAKELVADMVAAGLLEPNTCPSQPTKLRVTTKGARAFEEMAVKECGEYRRVVIGNKTCKMKTVEMLRRGMEDYDDLERYPKWEEGEDDDDE